MKSNETVGCYGNGFCSAYSIVVLSAVELLFIIAEAGVVLMAFFVATTSGGGTC